MRGRRPITHYLHVGIRVYLPCFIVFVRGLLRRQQYRSLIAGKWCCLVFFARACVWYLQLLLLPGHVRTVRSTAGLGSKVPAYLGVRPTDDLSVEFEGWATLCRIALVERSLTRSPPPWRSVSAEAEYSSAPLQGRNNLSIAVSTVTGRSMLPSGSTTTNYYK